MAVYCNICRTAHVETVDEAIKAGWVPGYFDGDEEVEGPVCPECCEAYLRVGDDGELESFNRFNIKCHSTVFDGVAQ